ncbi:Crp/Fnr family transcriptional regulator [Novispirillum sp. DQ9]|uniref:Crp/Fnr family transcriptional regulator n=1 Tax=Novispirillum sp. DQ9 TaxID=3398612 RepID=UPI003C7B1535
MPLTTDPATLRPVILFQGLDDAALAAVLAAGRPRRLEAGQRIFGQGEPAATCHVLIHGEVKIVQTAPEGQQVIVHFLGPPEMYGTVATLMGAPMPADAFAVTEAVEVVWTRQAMDGLMDAHPRIARNALKLLGQRLMQAQRRIREMSTERVDRRIARALLRMAQATGRKTEEGVDIPFPLSRQDLAELTGTTLHTVSRTLSAWEADGIVLSTRRHVVVRDAAALKAVAENA